MQNIALQQQLSETDPALAYQVDQLTSAVQDGLFNRALGKRGIEYHTKEEN